MEKINRYVALLLVLVVCLSLTACGESKEVRATAKSIYDSTKNAYAITLQVVTDYQVAIYVGTSESNSLFDGGVSYLADKVSLTEKELLAGLCDYEVDFFGDEKYANATTVEKSGLVFQGFAIIGMEDVACCQTVKRAYEINGDLEKVQTELNAVEIQLEELKEASPKYAHYDKLKELYTAVSDYFTYFQDPGTTVGEWANTLDEYEDKIEGIIGELSSEFKD